MMKAIGITCGIGSMLVGARQAGFDVVGNVEWRRYYHARDEHGMNTFTANFPEALFKHKVDDLTSDEIERMMGVELALGHPECGAYSNLNDKKDMRLTDPSDIPLFVDLIAKLQPRFFVMDDLPKSLVAFPMEEYRKRLPGYDLFPEWVSNYHYGNPQKHRRRMFMIGSRVEERWAFVPGEDPAACATVQGTIGVLVDDEGQVVGNIRNHREHNTTDLCGRALHLGKRGYRPTWGETRDWFLKAPSGDNFHYQAADGREVVRFGFAKAHWEGPCHVLTGGNATVHPLTGLPFSIRERARLQGFPDDFAFYGEILDDDFRWNHLKNLHMVKQTGKAMPIQFCRYVSQQVATHLRGEEFKATGQRAINPNPHVNEAKTWYCQNVGYSDQERACASCWLWDKCSIRPRSEPVVKAKATKAAKPPRASASTPTRRRNHRFGETSTSSDTITFGGDHK